MKSIKTGIVVVVMLVVVYGVWQMINNKPIAPQQGVSDLMSANFPDVQFPGAPEGGALQPPAVQIPGPGAANGNAQANAGAATMPNLRPPAPMAPSGTEAVSPFANRTGEHQHDGEHAGHRREPAPVVPAVGAPVVSPNGAPVVGPEAVQPVGTSRFAAGGDADASTDSVYGQPQSDADSGSSSWGSHDSATEALGSTGFEMAWGKVQQQLSRGQLADALAELSVWYGSSEIPQARRDEMSELLDQLAGAVIYSPEHLLEQPHRVGPGETLADIALAYQVPPQLLANINGINESSQLAAGTELKVIQGPFNALISLDRQELTLIVGPRYAGRFPIAVGNDPPPRTGEFVVREKEMQRTFIDRDGRTIPHGDDANPYGPYWIGLDGSMGIHGAAPPSQSGQRESTGSIIVSAEDARDLFAILSADSRIVIRR